MNPNGEVKAIHTLRSGTQYFGPPMPEEEDQTVAKPAAAESQPETAKTSPATASCGPQEGLLRVAGVG
ncbi:hypothetical protein GCM10007855_41870 [Aliivibrio sifiae]|uniref:Uncharacterized protein n=1 Tax=Aliivibrio sifiae TaxID=566293 RepID=A0ABQ6AQV6_9GAMM|nr:hypothetical protein GCM10007855_41870 [Aliivibrio sifiae]